MVAKYLPTIRKEWQSEKRHKKSVRENKGEGQVEKMSVKW